MAFSNSSAVIRRTARFGTSLPSPSLTSRRAYATHHGLGTTSQNTRRKTVTAFNDDGNVPWADLSSGEKAARATQQTFNFGLILVGLVMTGGIAYFLYQDVFSLDSKTAHFNRAVDLIKKDPACLSVLGDAKKISAHGEETFNKWRRSRPIASTIQKDRRGIEHMMMHFYVEGPLNRGVVNLHMTRHPKEGDFEYKYLYLDVKGRDRIYLKNADHASSTNQKKSTKLFGIRWA